RSNATGTHHRWKLATATGNQTVGQVNLSPIRAAVPSARAAGGFSWIVRYAVRQDTLSWWTRAETEVSWWASVSVAYFAARRVSLVSGAINSWTLLKVNTAHAGSRQRHRRFRHTNRTGGLKWPFIMDV
ncbi:hypothetical protein MRU69_13815, partial [Kocuria flava]|uniref:hypothetical protein n=1 Tax=Kocuria flava TaxID=446860 RepID=UPI001FF1A690